MKTYLVGMVVGLVGCASDTQGIERVRVESNELGIAVVEISHAYSGGERLLEVRGLDAQDEERGRASLREGRVLYASDTADPEWTTGSQLDLAVGDQRFSDISPDLLPHVLRNQLAPTVARFVQLGPVAAAIAESGITFIQRTPTEKAYSSRGGCADLFFPSGRGGSDQCCANYGDDSQDYIIQTLHKIGGVTIGNRSTYGYACRNSDLSTGCTGTGCYYGPCGFHVDGQGGGPNVVVFYPNSASDVCGWDVDADHDSTGWPEEWDGTQQIAPSVGAACTCSGCDSDGKPTPFDCDRW